MRYDGWWKIVNNLIRNEPSSWSIPRGCPRPSSPICSSACARRGRGASAEPGVEGFSEGCADLHASQHFAGGDRRAAGCVPAHDLAGRQGHDRCNRPGPEGRAAHGRGGAPGLRLSSGRHPLPLLELAQSPRIVVAVSTRRPA